MAVYRCPRCGLEVETEASIIECPRCHARLKIGRKGLYGLGSGRDLGLRLDRRKVNALSLLFTIFFSLLIVLLPVYALSGFGALSAFFLLTSLLALSVWAFRRTRKA